MVSIEMKRWLHKFVADRLGLYVYPRPKPGWDLAYDLRSRLPGYTAETVFDVGANEGQSAEKFLKWFPNARIECFEPVSAVAEGLRRKYQHNDRVRIHQLALCDTPGTLTLSVAHKSTQSTIMDHEHAAGVSVVKREEVTASTVDAEMLALSVPSLSYLKIDVEGAEKMVLSGAATCLREQEVGFVQIEVGMTPRNTWHTPLREVDDILVENGYLLFGVYEQMTEFMTIKRPFLRRSDLVYISPVLADRYSQPR